MKTLDYITTKYSVEAELPGSPAAVFDQIIDLNKWWPEEQEGEPIRPGAEFILKTGDGHHSKNRVMEFVPGKTLVWLTLESLRTSDGYDWSGTKFIFELTPEGNSTRIRFTYDGVVLEHEQEILVQICDTCIKEMLYNFIANGKVKQQTVKSYTATIEVTNAPHEIFQRITADVAKWWGGKDFSGRSGNVNDEFIVDHPGAHYSRQKLVEVVPDKKIVWLVTESKLSWLKNQEEWTNTRMIFEISTKSYSYLLQFTHEGLVPEKESYTRCSEGWNVVIKDWLYTLIMYGKAHFE